MSPDPRRRVAVVGAGLAGLAAAVAAVERGAAVQVFERRSHPGGISSESAGWIWRYRDLRIFRTCAPHGDPVVQRAVVERLDDDLEWLEHAGGRVVTRGTARDATSGTRFDMPATLAALADRLGSDRLRTDHVVVDIVRERAGGFAVRTCHERAGHVEGTFDRVVLAGGGYAADFERVAREAGVSDTARRHWVLRSERGGDGSSAALGAALGSEHSSPTGECFARIAPLGVGLEPVVRARFGELLELPSAQLRDASGRLIAASPHDWSGSGRVWTLARTTGHGTVALGRRHLRDRVHGAVVDDVLRAVERAGGRVERAEGTRVLIPVTAGITHTIDGLRVDDAARCLRVGGLYAAGCDAAGSGAGGYASGLAQALVLGRLAGADAAGSGTIT